jgi:glucosamine--fructose-6-phosphate aminotransferase (isomerizing)
LSLQSEIFEQPDILGRLLENSFGIVQDIAGEISSKDIAYVFLAARGTSDNAGLYAKYVWGAFNQLPIALAAPSLFTLYERPPDLKNALVVGISQSGQSPDLVRVIEEGRRQGAPTMTITNDPTSPLAQNADYVIGVRSGAEEAVAATKTYTAQLLAIAMFSAAMEGDRERFNHLESLQRWVEQALEQDEMIASLVEQYRDMEQCVVLGRGYNYSTAFEWALKLKELAYVMASPFSSADFQHGPSALLTEGFPVFAVAPSGAGSTDMIGLLTQLVGERKVDLLVISNEENALTQAHAAIVMPAEVPEWLTPIVSIVSAQLVSYHLARVKGLDTENPRGLQKVTKTW